MPCDLKCGNQVTYGRIPASWDTAEGVCAKGFVLLNARTALDHIRKRLEPLDFDVEYRLPRPLADAGSNSKRG